MSRDDGSYSYARLSSLLRALGMLRARALVLLSRAQALFSSHLELVVLFLPSVVVIPTLCSPFLLGFGLLLRRRVEAFSSREHLVRGRDPRVARARVGQDEVEGLALAYDAQTGLAFRFHRDRRRGRVGVLDRARADGAPREPRLVLRQPQVDLLAGKSELLRAFDADLWKVRGSGRSFEGLASPNAPSTPPCAFARADRVAPAWPNPRSSKGPRSDCPYRRSTCGGGYGWPIGSPPRWMLKSTLCFYVRRWLWMAHRRPRAGCRTSYGQCFLSLGLRGAAPAARSRATRRSASVSRCCK